VPGAKGGKARGKRKEERGKREEGLLPGFTFLFDLLATT
jgi:hypothetical protein